jgi:hypothetical protein
MIGSYREQALDWRECDSGWDQIIYCLEDILKSIEKNNTLGGEIQVIQVKEKFGGLRYYYDMVGEWSDRDCWAAEGATRMAEYMSIRTCQRCGNPAPKGPRTTDQFRWLTTLCDPCFDKRG